VRAPDDSLLHFLDIRRGGLRGFEQDFMVDATPPPDEPLGEAARIDHIAQALPMRRLDAWTLFYRAVLGLEPAPSVVMQDPYGLIRSRAMESSDKAVRCPLNVSDAGDTAVGRSVARFAGAGVQHIAIAVEDAVAAASALRARGAPVLPVPANYYDDLAARFELDAALLAELRANNVFYDRDADGEYLHVYTTPFEGRFFFEAVERRGGYAQYGAANAPVRLAALAQWRSALERA
jgi:4-hydroxyphenylpyruvate dioxygenase